jgi:hypothetical protein
MADIAVHSLGSETNCPYIPLILHNLEKYLNNAYNINEV